MKKKVLRGTGLWLCIPGLVFLFEPNIAFADHLPNAVGYLLLLLGLSRVADLFDRVEDAVRNLTKMLWISLGILFGRELLATLMPESDKMNAFEGSTLLLIIGFVLVIMQIYYLLPALKDLFLGLEAVMERHATGVLPLEKKGKSVGERLASFSAFFVIANSALALLPELTVLSGAGYAAGKEDYDWYRFIGLFRTVAGIVAAVIGVIWLIRASLFLLRLCRDRGLLDTLEARYAAEILPRRHMLLYRRASFAFTFFIIGAVFTVNFRIDEKDLFPSLFTALLCLFGIVWVWDLWKGLRGRTATILSCGALLLVSAVREILSYLYFDRYQTVLASTYHTGAFRLYLGVRIAAVLECVAVFAFFTCLILLLRDVARGTGVSFKKSERFLSLRSYAAIGAYAAAMAGNAVEIFLHLQVEWLWWITLPLTLIAVALFLSLLLSVRDQLENNAQSEALHSSLTPTNDLGKE